MKRTLVVVAILTLATTLTLAVVTHAYAATNTGTSSAPCAKPTVLQGAQNLDSNGAPVGPRVGALQASSLRTDLAQSYAYDIGGSTVREIVPPHGWLPLTASASELHAYGFPDRPASGKALTSWKQLVGKYRQSGPPGLCEANFHAGLVANLQNHYWAGGVALNASYGASTFDAVVGGWSQTAFRPTCGANSAYLTWAGIGGVDPSYPALYNLVGGNGQGGLMQAGTSYYGRTNTIGAWFEAISNQYQFPAIAFSGSYGGIIAPGESIYSGVSYSGGAGNFLVIDATKGIGWSISLSTVSYGGQTAPMSAFYNGVTTDYVTEAPTDSQGRIMPLAQPYLGSTYYFYATADGFPIYPFRTVTEDQISYGAGHPYVDTTDFNGAGPWYDYWQRCQ